MSEGKIYVGQTKLKIRVTANHDINGATSTLIKFKKPVSKTIGEWEATVEDADTGIMFFTNFLPSTLDEAGDWKFWSNVTFSDGKKADGEVEIKTVWNPGC